MQVRERHRVVVDDTERADAGRRKVEQDRRAEPAGADHEDPRALERVLARATDSAQHDLPGIALDFFAREAHLTVEFHTAARARDSRKSNRRKRCPRTPGTPSSSLAQRARPSAGFRAISRTSLLPSLAPLPSAPRSSGPGFAADRRRRSPLRLRAARRPRPGAARQAALGAGLPARRRRNHHQQDVRLRHEGRHARARSLARRQRRIIVAGGMESMSNAPYLLTARAPAIAWATAALSTTCFSTAWRTLTTKAG